MEPTLSFFILGVSGETFLRLEAKDMDFVRQLAGSGNHGHPIGTETQHQLAGILDQSRKNDVLEPLKVVLVPLMDVDQLRQVDHPATPLFPLGECQRIVAQLAPPFACLLDKPSNLTHAPIVSRWERTHPNYFPAPWIS